jgi:hypothetical protein
MGEREDAYYLIWWDCALTDGTPYRIAVPRSGGDREVHDADADALIERFLADDALMQANWLAAFMLPRIARSCPVPAPGGDR